MSDTFLDLFDIPAQTLICPHPTIREFKHYRDFTEIDPEFNLEIDGGVFLDV
jgi:hypothetical protein